jgi:hypothetical protein
MNDFKIGFRPIWPFLAVTAALLVALLPMPYVYYTIMRIGIAATCLYAIASAPTQKERPYARWAVFIPIMLLFGLGRMSRQEWAPVDLAFAAFFLLLATGYRLRDWNESRRVKFANERRLAAHRIIAALEQRRQRASEDSLPF